MRNRMGIFLYYSQESKFLADNLKGMYLFASLASILRLRLHSVTVNLGEAFLETCKLYTGLNLSRRFSRMPLVIILHPHFKGVS